jgi:tetratricopeptide (TPR) repeat protein
MVISPPTGNELIAAVMFTDKSLLSIDQYLAGDEQIIIEPVSWPYNLHAPNNAVQYCERLFSSLYHAPMDEYSVKSRFIKTYPIVSLDQASKSRDRGIGFFKKEKYLDAIAEFVKVVNVNPDDEIAIEYLSLSYFKQAMILFDGKKYLQAKKAFEASLQYDESCNKCSGYIEKSEEIYKRIHYDKGISYFGDEQLAEAIVEWELVHTLDPNYEKVESNLQKARAFLNKLEQIKKDQ